MLVNNLPLVLLFLGVNVCVWSKFHFNFKSYIAVRLGWRMLTNKQKKCRRLTFSFGLCFVISRAQCQCQIWPNLLPVITVQVPGLNTKIVTHLFFLYLFHTFSFDMYCCDFCTLSAQSKKKHWRHTMAKHIHHNKLLYLLQSYFQLKWQFYSFNLYSKIKQPTNTYYYCRLPVYGQQFVCE